MPDSQATIAHSILYPQVSARPDLKQVPPPDCFPDLNLDQIVENITAGRQSYHLEPIFYAPLTDIDAIHYRQEVMQDLEDGALQKIIRAFADAMTKARRYLHLITQLDFRINQAGWFVEAVGVYGQAVQTLAENLDAITLQSRGMQQFRDYLARYVASERFTELIAELDQVRAELATVHYCIRIKEGTVWVSKCEPQADYSTDVLRTFDRFRQSDAKDYTVTMRPYTGMNHIDAQIAACVAKFYPDAFAHLDRFYTDNPAFLDSTIVAFDREVQFYLAYLEFTQSIRRAGLPFCYPEITTDKAIFARDSFDLALANVLTTHREPVVTNDFHLQGSERIFVVTGPNQGGKTTFARMFGQLHYLARLGLPAPGSQARLFLYDHLLTQFEKEEDIRTLRGKLADDLVRIHALLDRATPNSIVIMNEVFSSTTLQDAVFLSKVIMRKLEALDVLGVFVTFLDELAAFGEMTVSMVSSVAPDDPARRTYKIERRPADGLAYALSIAEKHGLTYDRIKERLAK